MMLRDEAKRLYLSQAGNEEANRDDWKEIHAEMEAVVAAKSDRAAGRVIEWWGDWEHWHTTPTAFARRFREAYRLMVAKKEAKRASHD